MLHCLSITHSVLYHLQHELSEIIGPNLDDPGRNRERPFLYTRSSGQGQFKALYPGLQLKTAQLKQAVCKEQCKIKAASSPLCFEGPRVLVPKRYANVESPLWGSSELQTKSRLTDYNETVDSSSSSFSRPGSPLAFPTCKVFGLARKGPWQ